MKPRRHSLPYFYAIFSFLSPTAHTFSIPGVQMTTYSKGDQIPLFVNSITSTETLLPVDYYDLPFCKPDKVEHKTENLGEYLTAIRIQSSPYQLTFLQNQQCRILCEKVYGQKHLQAFYSFIQNRYQIHFIVDNLPVSTIDKEGYLMLGYPLGETTKQGAPVKLYNHVSLVIGYNNLHTETAEQGRIVDFKAYPYSIAYRKEDITEDNYMTKCGADFDREPVTFNRKESEAKVYWTYSVEWVRRDDIEWRTRWDVYLETGSGSPQVHWFAIINALVIVLFLSGMVAIILMRNLHRDISRYNHVPTDEERAEEREESGWKLVHADVFRPPASHPILFCVMVGTGAQVLCMTLVTLFFATAGIFAPARRGSLITAILVCFVLLGLVAGYISARMYKTFRGKRWQACTLLTATLFPGLLFTTFFIINLFVWAWGSDAAVPFGSILLVFFLWTGISVPLVFAGAFAAYRLPPISFPVATSNIPRPIPIQQWYMTDTIAAIIGGILPFGAIFVELFFVLSSLWDGRYYYVFGFLMLSFLILIHTCAQVTIVLTYFQLCNEDYRWWWRSFKTAGASGCYVFLYSCYYFWTRLDVTNFIGAMLYFGYMAIISGGICLLTGCVGFFATFFFARKMYASIKVD